MAAREQFLREYQEQVLDDLALPPSRVQEASDRLGKYVFNA